MRFWKKALAATLLAAMTVGLAGCGGDSKGGTETKKAENPKHLTVYMSVVEQHALVLAKEFEKDTGIKVDFVRMSGGEVLSRVRAEKDNPKASVWYGGSADSFIVAKKEGLLAKYVSPNAAKIPAQFKDPDGYWTGIYQSYLGFVMDGRFFDENKIAPPKTWQDLLKPEFKGHIMMGNPGSASTGYLIVSTFNQMMGEEKAAEYMAKLHKQIKQYTKAGEAPARSAALGECAIGITYIHNGIRMMKEGYDNVKIAVPEEGTSYELGTAAIINKAPEMEAAKKFMDWCLTKKAQELGQKNNSLYFLTNPEADPPKEAMPYKNSKLINYNYEWSGTNRARLLEAWNKTIKQ